MARRSVIASAIMSVLTAVSLVSPVASAETFPSMALSGTINVPSDSLPLSTSGLGSLSNLGRRSTSSSLAKQFPDLKDLIQPPSDVTSQLRDIVTSIRKEYGGTVAVAISNGTHTYIAGDDTLLRTWSTIKVPLAIAALRENPRLRTLARASITVSDNKATTALWNSLGGGSQAAEAVTGVIKEAGATAQVSTAAWGVSSMKPSQQAKFGARLRCLPRASTVRSLMGQIVPEQSYGLGRIPNTIFKGGWGPSADSYVIRQFGSVSVPGGSVGLAFYIEPRSGTYGTAQKAANKIASKLEPLITKVGVSVC